jgi:hypothetical protein
MTSTPRTQPLYGATQPGNRPGYSVRLCPLFTGFAVAHAFRSNRIDDASPFDRTEGDFAAGADCTDAIFSTSGSAVRMRGAITSEMFGK